jgi:hypothetical protein
MVNPCAAAHTYINVALKFAKQEKSSRVSAKPSDIAALVQCKCIGSNYCG